MLLAGDERKHNNPDLAYVDSDFIRGGGRVTATLTTLLTDFVNKTDQLKENVTLVYIISENAVYRLKSIANIDILATGWKKETVDLTTGAKIGAINTLTGMPAFEFIEGGDTNSELVVGTATVTGQVLKILGFRAGGDRGQNGAPPGRFPLRMELNFGVRWCLPGVNANVGGKNHFGVYQANGTTEIIYIDNEGTIRMAIPAQNGTSSDYIAIIGSDGTLKKISQASLRSPYRGTFTTLAALQATSGLAGDYASLDAGADTDAVSYIYDISDNKWVPSSKKTASNFSELGGAPSDNVALATALGSKIDKVNGKDLSDQNYTLTEKNKLGTILSGFNILFTAPRRDLPAVYFEKSVKVTAINLNGASAFSYSINGGASYITPTNPLPAGTTITLPAATFIKFRITFSSNVTDATAYLRFE